MTEALRTGPPRWATQKQVVEARGVGGYKLEMYPFIVAPTPSRRNPWKALERAELSGDPLPSSSWQVASSRID